VKGTPAPLEGPLTSKPTWPNTSGCSTTSAFFIGVNPPTIRIGFSTAALPQGICMGLLLLIVLILLLVGGLPTWGHSRNWGYAPSGGIGLLLIILLVVIIFTDVIHISRF
jgi:Protein of unknown function (DUF3309)